MDLITNLFNFDHLIVYFLILVVFVGFFRNRTQHFLNRIWESHHLLIRNTIMFILLTLLIYFLGQDLYYWSNLIFISNQMTASILYLFLIFFDLLFLYYQVLKLNSRKNRRIYHE